MSSCFVIVPDGASLVERKLDVVRPRGQCLESRATGASVADHGGRVEGGVGEAGGDDDMIVHGGLVGGEQHGEGLADMNVDGGVRVLNRVSALHLDQRHIVPLDEDVERVLDTNVGNAQSVCLSCMEEKGNKMRAEL